MGTRALAKSLVPSQKESIPLSLFQVVTSLSCPSAADLRPPKHRRWKPSGPDSGTQLRPSGHVQANWSLGTVAGNPRLALLLQLLELWSCRALYLHTKWFGCIVLLVGGFTKAPSMPSSTVPDGTCLHVRDEYPQLEQQLNCGGKMDAVEDTYLICASTMMGWYK